MTLLHASKPVDFTTYDYFINSQKISTVSKVRDLGVIISCYLKWAGHISHIYHMASVSAIHILCVFFSHNVWTLLHAFIIFVRPIVEYNFSVWSPNLKKDIDLIESVQKRLTCICVCCNIPFNFYSDRLHKLNLISLEYQRVISDLILMCKICHNLSSVVFSNYYTLLFEPRVTIYVNMTGLFSLLFPCNFSRLSIFLSTIFLRSGINFQMQLFLHLF